MLNNFIIKLLKRFKKYILQVTALRFIIIFTILSFIVPFISYFLNYLLALIFKITLNNFTGPLENASILNKAITACIIAPILETLIFQWLIIETMIKKISSRFAIFTSAALFGLSHFYNPLYIINTFFIGLLFGLVYILAKVKNFNPILITLSIHSVHNFIILCIEVFLNLSA